MWLHAISWMFKDILEKSTSYVFREEEGTKPACYLCAADLNHCPILKMEALFSFETHAI
jgi:hypothetical protein